MMAKNIPLNTLVTEAADSPDTVGAALGAVASAQSIMALAAGPFEAMCYNFLNGVGYPWLTYILFGIIAISSLLPAVLFHQPNPSSKMDLPSLHVPPFQTVLKQVL